MLYTNGAAWLNGSEVPKSAAVFSGDMLQTRPDSTASIQSNGSSVMVLADSLVKFEEPAVELEHGAVRVTTSRGLAARAGDVTVKPAANTWTEFQVKKKRRRGAGAATAASGGIMSSPPVVYGGLAAIGGAAIWIWTRDESPVSPSCPSNPCQ
jgi:hypothetical protein